MIKAACAKGYGPGCTGNGGDDTKKKHKGGSDDDFLAQQGSKGLSDEEEVTLGAFLGLALAVSGPRCPCHIVCDVVVASWSYRRVLAGSVVHIEFRR